MDQIIVAQYQTPQLTLYDCVITSTSAVTTAPWTTVSTTSAYSVESTSVVANVTAFVTLWGILIKVEDSIEVPKIDGVAEGLKAGSLTPCLY